MITLLQFIFSFLAVFFKGFQQQNVIGGKYKSAFFVSYIMAALDIIIIISVAETGMASILPVGTGSAMGIITSMHLYRRIYKE